MCNAILALSSRARGDGLRVKHDTIAYRRTNAPRVLTKVAGDVNEPPQVF